MDVTIDLKNYDKNGTVFHRTAARAIISDGNNYLLIYSKYGDYKFPGGGMKEGETLEDTLIREVQEETGYRVLKDSIKKYGKVLERRKGKYDDILEMESHYFRCEIERYTGHRNLDDYEKEYNYQICWMTLGEAIEKNRNIIGLENCPWVDRETKVMECLLNG